MMWWLVLGILAMLLFTFALPVALVVYTVTNDQLSVARRFIAAVVAALIFALSFLPVAACFSRADDLHCPPGMSQRYYSTGPKSGVDYCFEPAR